MMEITAMNDDDDDDDFDSAVYDSALHHVAAPAPAPAQIYLS